MEAMTDPNDDGMLAYYKRVAAATPRGVIIYSRDWANFTPATVARLATIPNLIAFLKERNVLILLDNCEHVVEATASLAEALLKGAPDLDILATSREALRAEGEVTHRLGPMGVPPASSAPTAATALTFSSVQLFVERDLLDHFAQLENRFLRAGVLA